MSSVRILIVDDHEAVRGSIRSVLAERKEWVVCAEARDGLDAVEKTKELRPDVVLMDISMPRMDGLEATKIIRREIPECLVVLVSQNDPTVMAEQLEKVGASGYVAKNNLADGLILVIDKIMAGRETEKAEKSGTKVDQVAPEQRPAATELAARVKERFGMLPNFFRLSPSTPEITEKLWGFAQAGYLDNPMPSLFKERLFVYMSRFCEVRYCIARHVGFLAGLGRPSGDPRSRILTPDEIVKMLRRPVPRGEKLTRLLARYGKEHARLAEFPETDSEMEEAFFGFASHVFLQSLHANACLEALRSLLGDVRLEYLLLFLAFIRTAHYWTEIHPELTMEEDLHELMAIHKDLAECILSDPEARHTPETQKISDELPRVRAQAERVANLLEAIVDSTDDAIVSKNLDGVITSWNKGAERLFGYNEKEAIGKNITLIIPPERLKEEVTILERLRRGERINHFETIRKTKDGTLLDISLSISPLRDATGRVVGASKVARDITQRKQSERALQEREAQLRALAAGLEGQVLKRTQELEERNAEIVEQSEQLRVLTSRLLQTGDEERRHIARELHDSAGQIVTALGVSLGMALRQQVAGSPAQRALEDSAKLVEQLSREIRTTSYLLHPPLLDESGLSGALRWYIRGVAERSDLQIQLDIADDFDRLPRGLELAVFRIVQECLTNIHRHSGSNSATIRISRNAENLFLEVQDEGKGISADKLAALQSQRSGVGITGMRERVRHFGGSMKIESNGKGTKVSARFPINRNAIAQQVESTDKSRAEDGSITANL